LGTTCIKAQRRLLDLGASGSFAIKGVTYLGKPGVLNAHWYPWFGIIGLHHWGCWDASDGSYDGFDECRAAWKVMSVCTIATFLPCVALLLPVH
jgi:hypothetical protein